MYFNNILKTTRHVINIDMSFFSLSIFPGHLFCGYMEWVDYLKIMCRILFISTSTVNDGRLHQFFSFYTSCA